MALITHSEYSELGENDVQAFRAKAWNMLPWATADDLENGRSELLSTVAPIIDELPSAKRYEQSTENAIGWRGGNTVSTVVLSIGDEQRVGSLLRAWRKTN